MSEPVSIAPEAIYTDSTVRHCLGLSPAILAAARRAGTLRHARQGQRVLYKGAWILAWLDSVAVPAAPLSRERQTVTS
jgi:hypothetical protein